MKSHFAIVTLVLLSACQAPTVRPTTTGEAASAPEDQPALLAPDALTAPSPLGGASDPALWHTAALPGGALVLTGAGEGGLSVYDTDGRLLAHHDGIEAVLVDILDERAAPEAGALALAYDARDATLKAFRLQARAPWLVPAPAVPIPVADELTGLCSHRSRLSGSWYVYGTTDDGLLLHWELHEQDGLLQGRLLRRVPLGKGIGPCAVDANDGELYVSDEELGLWHLGAEPESDATRGIVDLAAPWGGLGEEIKGIAIYPATSATAYLLVADVGQGHIGVYAVPEGSYLGAVRVEGLSEPEGLAALGLPADAGSSGGWLAVADEDESDGATEFKLLAWASIAKALGLAPASSAPEAAAPIAVARPVAETEPVASWGDAADDPAIWVHPQDPELSLVLGTQKQLGLHVYDLAGRSLQFIADGRINNVDLRDGFPLDGQAVALVAASNRTHDSISLYRVDAQARRLVDVADGLQPAGLTDPYGLCLYRSAASGEFYVFVNNSGDGLFRQFRLRQSGPGRVNTELVREFPVGGQSEGCVADDESGRLYVAQEGLGLWRYGAEPDAGDARVLIDSIEGGRLVADVEGVDLWAGPDGTGFLLVSNQGEDNYVLYRREGDNAFFGKFHLVANAEAGIDGVSETDGLAVTSAPLGERFPDGLLVTQDGRNIAPSERQNFKYTSWREIMAAIETAARQ